MSPKDFHHPFEPYDIQQHFMEAMYQCIEDGKVGIFESPTGTGKSLSLICSSLTWLREHKRRMFDEAVAAVVVDDDEPDWMSQHVKETRRRELRQMREDLEARLQAVREREQRVRERQADRQPNHKRRKLLTEEDKSAADEEQFLLDDYKSDDGLKQAGSRGSEYSAETTQLMERLGMLSSRERDGVIEEEIDELKIFFCSRTHSQLSQFVGELQRVKLPPGLPPDIKATKSDTSLAFEHLKQLSLGSRKNLCINPKVIKLENPTAINERCIELQQASTSREHKCPYLPTKENEDLVIEFRDHALAKIRDIEDLASVGAKLGVCPYYASRPAIAPCEMVTLPYPLLLQKSAREALGISMKGHVVIIDEAHNLMSAIEGICSTQIAETQLKRARVSLMVYLQKFRNRLKGSNRVYVTQVVRVIDSLLLFISGLDGAAVSGGTLEPGQLLSGKAVDQINLSKLNRYISDSKLARKVEGYVSFTSQTQTVTAGKAKTKTSLTTSEVPTLTQVQNFLTTLMNPSKEGRFFWLKEDKTTVLRYMLLDPSEHFREIVEDARAVILAGGTMSPMDDYTQQLFPYLSSLVTFSCGHLIPQSNLLVRAIATDGDGQLEFSYKARNSSSIDRIGKALLEIGTHVKGGLVVFLPSYSFLDQVAERWRSQSLLSDLQKLKPVFWDDRSASAEVTFRAYSEAVASGQRGAILLSVIGGKLSEGINFADNLGRCVVVVGLPFPNLKTPEWRARMEYIDNKAVARGEPRGKASREHAENVCMRSVNQAIGRVVRHKNDWASIVLLDSRYTQQRIRAKLPAWMLDSFPGDSSSGCREVAEDVERFFTSRA